MIATARIIMPGSMIRLSAGRDEMSVEEQALCFMAGANSIFAGEKLLTTPNPEFHEDKAMFELLGINPRPSYKQHPSLAESNCHAGTPERLQKLADRKNCPCTDFSVPLIDFIPTIIWASGNIRIANAVNNYLLSGGETGSGGSRLLTGNHPKLVEAEEYIAKFHHAEAALFWFRL